LIYYKPKARTRRVDANLAEHVGVTMQRFPTYGYRRLAIVLGEHKKPIQRILQIKDCQVRKRSQGFRPRAKALPSVSHRLDECWAPDICQVWWDRDRRGALAAVIDCCTREILRWRLSSKGATETAEATLEEVDQPHGESLS
jgi:putative transposase